MSAAEQRVGAGQGTGSVVEQLRERIRQLQAAPRRYLAVLRTGLSAVDALLPTGGLPLGQVVELCGEAASGRTSLALHAVAAAHQEARLCAWVDGPRELYSPSAAALGVDLERLLIVRPQASEQRIWAAVQLARSGAFACVVLDLTRGMNPGGRACRVALAEARKLADAAARGGGLLLLLTSPESPADGVVRLRTEARDGDGWSVEVVRSRQGGTGARAELPWSALYPALGLEGGGRLLDVAEDTEDGTPDFLRDQSGALRNGLGILGQRPGRDAPMPPMRQGLDAALPAH
ncbi:putative recA protein [Myxococcus xanthus DK 1622]|uniref:Protein RecA n=1 Tax=Myxococcus xanthus (strain DK1622) TaxID=246197 RepID=Q1D5A2_MYXXD|nr:MULTISPECIES: recombinase RecA [Myxococcus]ABF92318.1 putative recA protein [Myxococcus xanthus DK 1622]NOJ51584.1 recombinase RecA [Myxococcus xanthus]QPM76613.1 recombinase RecA [Myxococcus xanthus]QVW65677.1 recombinase RecA [Myxococcus xanthus DZ2]QZZ51681.1 Protein RecA [Myxococcus xanthus]